MKNNLPCSVVRDLLPSYVEQLTDQETTELVKSHLQSCGDCRSLYQTMSGRTPVFVEDLAEVDYLKKMRRSRLRLVIAAACLAVLAAGAGLFLLLRGKQMRTNEPQTAQQPLPDEPRIVQAAMPEWTYDESAKTLVVYGTDDYTRLELPDTIDKAANLEVQDNNFHLSVYLPVLRNESEPLQTSLPGFLDRTDKSLTFLRSYLKEHAGGAYSEENAAKFVELTIRRRGSYSYTNDEDRICLEVGDYYWHRDSLYLLALLDFKTVEWQQLGYIFYLGMTVNPFSEQNVNINGKTQNLPYYEAYLALGGQDGSTPEDMLRVTHAAAWYGLNRGTGYWGSVAESRPVTEFAWYSGPAKAMFGNDMTVMMATSLIAWLTEQSGFEAVSRYCTGSCGFTEAFGTDFQTAKDAWAAWLNGAVESGK